MRHWCGKDFDFLTFDNVKPAASSDGASLLRSILYLIFYC